MISNFHLFFAFNVFFIMINWVCQFLQKKQIEVETAMKSQVEKT